jgi:hypothetical protein
MATTPKPSIFRKPARANVYEAAPAPAPPAPAASPERTFPPEPLDPRDGWPRLVAVRYMEPNPAAPDERAQDVERIAWWAFNSADPDAMQLLALEATTQVSNWARTERKKVLQEIGARMVALEARGAATPEE